MKGRVWSASFGRNLDMTVKWTTRRCNSLTLVGLRISIMALHFSGLASILCCVSMKPKNFLLSMPKTHFSWLSMRLYYHNAENTLDRSFACFRSLGDLTTMSSTYTLTHFPIR